MTETPAGWYPDPLRRFEHRYWDGTAWTEHVATGGQQQVDPPAGPPASPASTSSSSPPPAASSPTGGGGWDAAVPAGTGTNTKAILSLVLSIVAFPATMLFFLPGPLSAIAGIVLGFLARRELKGPRSHETGDGLALAGIIVGFAYLAIAVVAAVFLAMAFVGGGF